LRSISNAIAGIIDRDSRSFRTKEIMSVADAFPPASRDRFRNRLVPKMKHPPVPGWDIRRLVRFGIDILFLSFVTAGQLD